MSVSDSKFPKQVSSVSGTTQKGLTTNPGNIPVYLKNCRPSLKTSTDSGLGSCRSSCTCQCATGTSGGFSSQSSTSSKSSTSSHYCCCPPQTQPPQEESPNSHSLFKSSSCSTLPNMLMQTSQRSTQQKTAPPCGSVVRQRCPIPLQKTSSCSSLMNMAMNLPMTSVPVYNDSMMHVYAQVASVVPDDSTKSYNSHTNTTYQRTHAVKQHIYDTVRCPPVAVSPHSLAQRRNNTVTFRSYKSPKRTAISVGTETKDEAFLESRTKCDSSLNCDTKVSQSEPVRASTPSELYARLESRLVPYRRENRRDNPYCTMTSRRQNTASVSSLDAPNGYLKSALKQPKTTSQQNVYQPSDAQSQNGSATRIVAEAEYAVVDKSKKNRFTSLPALNKFNSNTCIPEDDKDQPPVPPKKNLYKSDFNIHRSRSSSPRKTFLERVNGFTKSAKHAFQRAFSTERIYRPEREERLEATGQNLHRSKSFIKGLRASLSKKRKKTKPPMAEVVPQASSNPLWDQQPSGPNSPVQVHGQLLQLNLDGSQVVELSKPPNRPYGFFVARGRVRNCKGVFVSRMRDQETQKQLAGLLDIGDEILEIEGFSVKNADIMEVNNLMANKNTLLLTVLPYICRKDI